MKKKQEKKPPMWTVILILISVFGGIIMSIYGIHNIQNYYHPYWFGLTFGGSGLIFGVLVAMKLKPIIAVNQRLKKDFHVPIMFISAGFFGLFLLAGSLLNGSLSEVDSCDKFPLIKKYKQEYRYARSADVNSLVVNIKGDSHRLVCSYNYWIRTSIGQDIELSIHNSKLGFDYITVINDKE